MTPSDPYAALREALKVSPDNVPLRKLLAQTLLSAGEHVQAETEFREALKLDGSNADIKLGLAKSFAAQGKDSQAIVILETLTKGETAIPAARIAIAKLHFKAGNVEEAVRQYKHAIAADASVADLDLQARLGITPDASTAPADDDDDNDVVDGRVRANWEGSDAAPQQEVERPKVNFNDVGGLQELKDEIGLKIIQPLKFPEMYAAYGKSAGGGILMYGPPGCGKTFLARATAGEINAGFMCIGINDVLDMWIGNSEKNLHALFAQARRNKPCVLFFDEVDALAASRADMRTSGGRHIINQFLSEMDGATSNNEGILILAATNAPWHVDAAFRRPGRFDRIIFVPPPDQAGRSAILKAMLKGKPQQDVDYDAVAAKTAECSGADLKAVVDLTIEGKLKEAMKTGRPQPIITKDLLKAASMVKPSTREWFSSARNYALYSNQGGAYDDIIKYLKM
jgi:transitional endoplasmic reticulum ATPase